MTATAKSPAATAPPFGSPLLEVDRLSVQFGRQQVLRDISISVSLGETLVILGESGCGKTVLLKNMIGLVRPTRGEVRFDGTSLASMRGRELARLRTRYGFVFQQAALFDSLTIFDNIAFPLREHTRISREEIREIVHSLLAEVGLPESVGLKKPAELSGGMRKRAGLARALAQEARILLLDEPTASLDIRHQIEVMRTVRWLADSSAVSVVVVAHRHSPDADDEIGRLRCPHKCPSCLTEDVAHHRKQHRNASTSPNQGGDHEQINRQSGRTTHQGRDQDGNETILVILDGSRGHDAGNGTGVGAEHGDE